MLKGASIDKMCRGAIQVVKNVPSYVGHRSIDSGLESRGQQGSKSKPNKHLRSRRCFDERNGHSARSV